MMRSMTGLGSAATDTGKARLSVEVRTVNHRFFNPVLKTPASLSRFEGEIRERLRNRIARGHVTLILQIERDAPSAVAIDEERFAAYATQLSRLSRQYSLGAVDAGAILRMPGVVASGSDEDAMFEVSEILSLVDTALDALDVMRIAEGTRMRDYLFSRLQVFELGLSRIEHRAPQRLQEQHARMQRAVAELLGGLAADEQRIAQEIAVMADRLDISEELGRLRSHLIAFHATLQEETSDARGKRLGFLVQEMLREVNTLGSKGADGDILRDVVLLKEELERVREQSENIE